MNYKEFSSNVFTSTLKEDPAKFDHHVLEKQIKAIIKHSPLTLGQDSSLKDPFKKACKTFLVATSIGSGGTIRLRTYDHPADVVPPSSISEAALVTLASPKLFQLIVLHDIKYGGVKAGGNNPVEDAIAEARNLWPNRPMGCLISIGTGIDSTVHLADSADIGKILERLSLKSSLRDEMAKYCEDCMICSDNTHRSISQNSESIGIHNR